MSLRSTFLNAVRRELASAETAPILTDGDLAHLPQAVQRYLRRVGVVGRPQVRNFHAGFRAEMRSGPDAPWMRAHADQYEFFEPPRRYFFMKAKRGVVPFDVFHRYVGDHATMQVRVAGLIPIVDLHGPEMTKSETVTLLNDMCVLAPATLVEAPIEWTTVDDRTVRATFVNAGHTVSGLLLFDHSGDLVDFTSDDRSMSEGRTMRRLPWSTPLSDYRDFDGVQLAARGEARWTDGSTTWTYGRFVLERIAYNVSTSELR